MRLLFSLFVTSTEISHNLAAARGLQAPSVFDRGLNDGPKGSLSANNGSHDRDEELLALRFLREVDEGRDTHTLLRLSKGGTRRRLSEDGNHTDHHEGEEEAEVHDEDEHHDDEEDHDDALSSNSKDWGGAMGGAILVLFCTLVGVAIVPFTLMVTRPEGEFVRSALLCFAPLF